MEAFAQRYYECNPHVYANAGQFKTEEKGGENVFLLAEVCYIVSFAIIMLNTSLHNKNARLGGGPFTYEKFVNSLSETITRHQMPDLTIIKVSSIDRSKREPQTSLFSSTRIFMII